MAIVYEVSILSGIMKLTWSIRIAFTWWGSGGHVLPIASLLEYAQQDTQIQQKCKALYRFGERGSLEEDKAGRFDDVHFVTIQSGKLRRYITLRSVFLSLRDLFRLIGWFFQSLWNLKKYSIDVVFCKWGYVVVPVCLAAKVLRIPIIVHESDTHMGLANKIAARMATKVFTGFDGVYYSSFTVWQLLSLSLSTLQEVPLENFDPRKPTVLFIGWSQGAHTLFALIPSLIEQYGAQFQYLVITGLKNIEWQEKLRQYDTVWALWFLEQSELARMMAQSDLSVTRGSATSLAEQHLFGIKKCIVPLPFTWGNHQEINADWYVKEYNDRKLLQDNSLTQWVIQFLEEYKDYTKASHTINKEALLKPHRIIWQALIEAGGE